jgi:hypothetical protein
MLLFGKMMLADGSDSPKISFIRGVRTQGLGIEALWRGSNGSNNELRDFLTPKAFHLKLLSTPSLATHATLEISYPREKILNRGNTSRGATT